MQNLSTIKPTTGESPFDRIRLTTTDGSERWSARDLMPLMGYSAWRNFEVPLNRAMATAENQGQDVESHFARSRNVVERPQGGGSVKDDYRLSRYAAYLVAMNGDPNKPEVAAAQNYFAIQTRVAETSPVKPLEGKELLAAAFIEAQAVMKSQQLQIEAADKYIDELRPKADYVDTFVADEDQLSFSTVASTLGLKESELREILIDAGWIYRETSSRWSAKHQRKLPVNRYSEYAGKKPYFYRKQNHDVPRFRGEVMHTLKITPPGAQAIARLVARRSKELVS